MTIDTEGYGVRPGQSDVDRLLEDARTLSPFGVERAAQGWTKHAGTGAHPQWIAAERAALHALETSKHAPEWDELRDRILGLTEQRGAMVAWRQEHGEVGHHAESALLGAALALMARPRGLDEPHVRTLLLPMAEALPWLTQ
ncbi:MAG TPA: hypothetical protein VN193_06655 [Candidatus Angelobacter sp.]|jgi:hypothetical protein|nr:hypothetical protein [Candidatus Angelobacter sp.]